MTDKSQAYIDGFDSMTRNRDILAAASDKALIRWLKELEEDCCDYSDGGADVIRGVLKGRNNIG